MISTWACAEQLIHPVIVQARSSSWRSYCDLDAHLLYLQYTDKSVAKTQWEAEYSSVPIKFVRGEACLDLKADLDVPCKPTHASTSQILGQEEADARFSSRGNQNSLLSCYFWCEIPHGFTISCHPHVNKKLVSSYFSGSEMRENLKWVKVLMSIFGLTSSPAFAFGKTFDVAFFRFLTADQYEGVFLKN